MPNGTMGTPPEPANLGAVIERLTKLKQADLDWVKAAIDAVENDDDGDGYETPAEWLVIQMLVNYTYSRLTPESVEADLEHFAECVKDLKDEPEPTTPEEIGAKIRNDLRKKLRARLRREFQDWAKEASERDLLVMMEVLVSAQNSQSFFSDFDASFLTGFARMLDRDDVLYCPTEYVSCVQRYIAQLTGRKAVGLMAEITGDPLPSWVIDTPAETNYTLFMDNPYANVGNLESIDMTRAEYKALKLRLAELRGYVLTPEQKEKLG